MFFDDGESGLNELKPFYAAATDKHHLTIMDH